MLHSFSGRHLAFARYGGSQRADTPGACTLHSITPSDSASRADHTAPSCTTLCSALQSEPGRSSVGITPMADWSDSGPLSRVQHLVRILRPGDPRRGGRRLDNVDYRLEVRDG